MPRGFYCQFDYIVSFKALERHIMKTKRLEVVKKKQTNVKSQKGEQRHQRTSRKHTTLVGFGPGRC